MKVKITPVENGPVGKLAEAELHFTPDEPLANLKLIGFGIWERRDGGRNVTFPARSYSVNGETRSFALLRPVADVTQTDTVRDVILAAYAEHTGEHPPDSFFAPAPKPAPPAPKAPTSTDARLAAQQDRHERLLAKKGGVSRKR